MSSYKDFRPIVAIEGAKMGQKSGPVKEPAEQLVKEIRRATRRQFSAEEKIRIVLSGLRGEGRLAESYGLGGGRAEEPALSPRELAVHFTDTKDYFVSEASVYRLLKARDLIASPAFVVIKAAEAFKNKTTAPNQLWQTDFTYLKVIGWGWFYLSTVLDDFSRYIVAWKLCTNMRAEEVIPPLDLVLRASGLIQANPADRPRLLSDNGSSYVAGDLAKWLGNRNIKHLRGAPYHPMTQGKIERWHQTLKNRILLENYFLPGDLEAQLAAFVDDYNHRRYHESIDNLTPADVYFGRAPIILADRERIKRQTIANRRLQHRLQAA